MRYLYLLLLLATPNPLLAEDPYPTQTAAYWLGETVPTPQLAIEEFGVPAPGNTIRMQFRDGPAGATAALLFRIGQAGQIIEPLVAGDAAVVWSETDNNGFVSLPIPLPAWLSPGLLVDFQWIALDPASGALLKSETLRAQVLPSDRPIYVSMPLTTSLELQDTLGGSGQANLAGVFEIMLTAGADANTMLAQLQSVSQRGDSITLSNGLETGELVVELQQPLTFVVNYQEGLAFNEKATLGLHCPLFDLLDRNGSQGGPDPVYIEGVLLAGCDGSSGALSGDFQFLQRTGSPEFPEAGVFDMKGSYLQAADYLVLGDRFKHVLKIRVNIIRDSNGQNPTWTQNEVDAAITRANDIWCPQCCIRFEQDGATQFLDVTAFDVLSQNEITSIDDNHDSDGHIDVFFTKEIAGTPMGTVVNGGHTEPTAFVGREGTDDGVTLAHELGHVIRQKDSETAGNVMGKNAGLVGGDLTEDQCWSANRYWVLQWTSEICDPVPLGQ